MKQKQHYFTNNIVVFRLTVWALLLAFSITFWAAAWEIYKMAVLWMWS